MTLTHGLSAYRNSRCRCDVCRTAHRDAYRVEQVVRRARLAADFALAEHGTTTTYRAWGCRCQPCTDANAAACREYYQRTKQRVAS